MAAVGVGAGELLWHLCDARAVTAALAAHFGREYDDAVAHLLARGLLRRREDEEEEEEEEDEEEEEEEDEEEAAVIPMANQGDITVTSMTRGGWGFRDGSAAQAQFYGAVALALMDDGSILVVERDNCRIRLISANGKHVRTIAGSGVSG